MAGTAAGARKTAQTNKERHGEDFYHKIGKKSAESYAVKQRLGTAKPRGFAANKELARRAGRKGGTVSKRVRNYTSEESKDTGLVIKNRSLIKRFFNR